MCMCSDAHVCTCTNTHRHDPISHVQYRTVLWGTQWEFMLGRMLSWACSVDIVYFPVLWWWHHGLKRLGKKHLFAFHFQIILHHWESQGWNSRQELEAVTQAETTEHYWLAFLPIICSACIFKQPRTAFPGTHPPWAKASHVNYFSRIFPWTCLQANMMDAFSQLRISSQIMLACVNLTKQTNKNHQNTAVTEDKNSQWLKYEVWI